MARIADRDAGNSGMSGIPNAGILADHAAFSDRNPGHRHKVNSGREHHIVPKFNGAAQLRLQMQIRIKQNVPPKAYIARSVDVHHSLHNRRFV